MKRISTCFLFVFCSSISHAQNKIQDSLKLDYAKIYALCLDGNVKPVISLLELDSTKKVTATDLQFKTEFENRFKYEVDKSNYLTEKKSSIDSLLLIFRNYWRKSVLDTDHNYDSLFIREYHNFLKEKFSNLTEKEIKEDSTDLFLRKYLNDKNLFTTNGVGKTGRIYDLLVWKNQTDTTYTFNIYKEKITVNVVFMKKFVTLGWEEYATLGKYYPSGWATDKALYCVESAYDLKSEKFLISYLAHEGRHFRDYKLFPKLASADLEYRAKLTELSLADKTIYKLIKFFIRNANYDSDNGHSVANFCAIRDLSKSIFGVDFEKDIGKWESVSRKKINKAAHKIFQSNTKALQLKGTNVEKFIKP
jgi:hypothetical protein